MRTPKWMAGFVQKIQNGLRGIAVRLHWTDGEHPNQGVELSEMALVLPILVASIFGLAYFIWASNCSLACAMVFIGISAVVLGGFALFDRIIRQG